MGGKNSTKVPKKNQTKQPKTPQILQKIRITSINFEDIDTTPISALKAFKMQIEDKRKIQTVFKTEKKLIKTRLENSFLATCRLAYNHHQGFILDPADLWQLIAQGFGKHVNLNYAELRDKIVGFEGRKEVEIISDMIYGDPDNKWEEVLPSFSEEIKKNIGEELHTILISNFTTTTSIERAASEATLMYSMQKYFSFHNIFKCGIPEFHIIGKTTDWENLITKTQNLEKYNLEWWIPGLVCILNKILDSVKGDVDERFWRDFYRKDMKSGGDTLHGWIVNFFPYMKEDERNKDLGNYLMLKGIIGARGLVIFLLGSVQSPLFGRSVRRNIK